MLRDELKQLLRELADATGATAVTIGPGDCAGGEAAEQDHSIAVAIGGGQRLWVTFAVPESAEAAEPRAAAVERAARAIRASARRWDDDIPEMEYPESSTARERNVRARIEAFLVALSNSLGMINATVVVSTDVISSATPLTELQRERIPLIIKQVAAAAARSAESSHAEITAEDFYARSFWFDAYVVAYFDRPYSADFVRHRTRLVIRELSKLLPMLDDPDHDPVITAPSPPSE